MFRNINYFTESKSEQVGVLGNESAATYYFQIMGFIKEVRYRYF